VVLIPLSTGLFLLLWYVHAFAFPLPFFRVPMPIPDGAWIVQSPTYGLSSLYMCYGWRLTARPNVAEEGANGSGVGGYGITMPAITLARAYSLFCTLFEAITCLCLNGQD